MKILVFLERCAVRGGIEIFAERHIANLRANGHDVDVAHTLPEDFSAYDEVIVHKCTDVSALGMFPPEKTVYYVHDHEPICPRTYAYTPFRRNCTRASGLWPCLLCAPVCRSWRAAFGRVLVQGRRKRTMARFRRIVVISEFMKGRLVANGMPAAKIIVEPPTIPCPSPSANRQLPDKIDLLFVGQLVRGKGVQLLLDAMARMKAARTLDVVGTGNMAVELRAQSERLGLGSRVRWHGFQENPHEWMSAAKCVVVPSFWQEPYGLVAAEAVALGKDVVAFAVGGLPEACQGKATLVPPGDIDALAAVLDGGI